MMVTPGMVLALAAVASKHGPTPWLVARASRVGREASQLEQDIACTENCKDSGIGCDHFDGDLQHASILETHGDSAVSNPPMFHGNFMVRVGVNMDLSL